MLMNERERGSIYNLKQVVAGTCPIIMDLAGSLPDQCPMILT